MRNYTQTYQYDEIGNLLQMKSNGVWTRDYRYDFATNNYLLDHDLQGTTDTYLYDAHGNMTKMPHLQEMKYDYADQLNEVTLDASNNKAYYVYNASGERVRKVVVKNNETIVEDRFYIGDYELYSKKTNGSLDVKRETLYITDDKQKVALIDTELDTNDLILATTIRYQYTNHLDSASLELDETGDIISYEEYHPFGTTSYRSGRSEIDVSLKRYKYVHKELDNETGLYYYGMRYYAPWIAKFISVDPLQFKYPDLTPFQYASNAPISNVDLDGAEKLDMVDNTGMWSTMPSSGTISEGVTFSSNEDPANYKTEGFSSLYMGKIPKYPYTGSGWDYVAQFDNAAINLLNTVPSLWNSAVANVENLVGGTWSDQMSKELNYSWNAIETRAKIEWNYAISTRLDKQFIDWGITWSKPQNLEMLTTAVFASQLPNFQLPKFKTYPKINFDLLEGGKTFSQYKLSKGGGGQIGEIDLFSSHKYYGNKFPINIEYSHRFITQYTQTQYNLPNWLVNNRLNVMKTNTLFHASHDLFRYRFLPREIKLRLGPGGDLNYTMFGRRN